MIRTMIIIFICDVLGFFISSIVGNGSLNKCCHVYCFYSSMSMFMYHETYFACLFICATKKCVQTEEKTERGCQTIRCASFFITC